MLRAAPLLLALTASVAGCPAGPLPATPGFPALSPSQPGSLTRIDVRHFDSRPRLALVIREGNPAPALALAALTTGPPATTVAMATLVERRLLEAGFDVDVAVDRMVFRIMWWPADVDRIEAFVTATAQAFAAPVAADAALLEQVAARYASLKRHPLESPALVPITACTGELGISGPEAHDLPLQPSPNDLEQQRRRTLGANRTAMAAVGPEAFAEAAIEALEDGPAWPAVKPAAAPPTGGDQVDAYRSPTMASGTARIHLALRVGAPQRAASAAAHLGTHPSPLLAKLAALQIPWRLQTLNATALPSGGCVSALLTPVDESSGDLDRLVPSAARATSLVRDELIRALELPPDPHLVTAQISNAQDPREAAHRAAWWSLAAPAAVPRPRLTSVLGLPSGKEQPPADEPAADGLGRRYAQALAERPLDAGAVAERRVQVERGQGQLWALLASPCVLQHEGPHETGRAALAIAAAVRNAPRTVGVTVQPWIDANGVGIIAHGGPRIPSESPDALAARIGRALGRATATDTLRRQAFVSAKGQLTRALQAGEHRYLERFCEKAVPDHPSWLWPLGALERHVSFERHAVLERWHEALRGPLRLAVIANASPEQAEVLAQEVDRWLLPEARAGDCPQQARPAAPDPGTHRLDRLPPGASYVLVGARLPRERPDDPLLAELTASLLQRPDGVLASTIGSEGLATTWSAEVLGGGQVATLLVSVRAAPGKHEPLRQALSAALEQLRARGPTATQTANAVEDHRRRQQQLALDPRHRLGGLWNGQPPTETESPDPERWREWLQGVLASANLVIVAPPVDG